MSLDCFFYFSLQWLNTKELLCDAFHCLSEFQHKDRIISMSEPPSPVKLDSTRFDEREDGKGNNDN